MPFNLKSVRHYITFRKTAWPHGKQRAVKAVHIIWRNTQIHSMPHSMSFVYMLSNRYCLNLVLHLILQTVCHFFRLFVAQLSLNGRKLFKLFGLFSVLNAIWLSVSVMLGKRLYKMLSLYHAVCMHQSSTVTIYFRVWPNQLFPLEIACFCSMLSSFGIEKLILF